MPKKLMENKKITTARFFEASVGVCVTFIAWVVFYFMTL